MRKALLVVSIVSTLAVHAVRAQEAAPLDGPQRPFQDSLFDKLAGTWFMSGTVGSRPAGYMLHATWVLGHQFLRLGRQHRWRGRSGHQFRDFGG